MKTMQLSTDTDVNVENPSKEQIREIAVDVATRRAGGFVILGESEMSYMQAAGDEEKRFAIEYQEGSLAKHFRAKERLSVEQTVEMLSSYCRGGTEWKTAAIWVPSSIRPAPWWKFW